MTTPAPSTIRRNFAATIGRLGLTAAATSGLAMLYKLAMPRAMGTTELAHFYFAETFPFLFFALVPFGFGAYISRELAGRPDTARETLPSILAFEAMAGAVAFALLLVALHWRMPPGGGSGLVVELMGIACLAVIVQQRILRPAFIALGAASFVTRLEITVRAVLTAAILLALALHPDLRLIAGLQAAAESSAVAAYVWAAARRGWLGGRVRFATMGSIFKASLPFTAVAVMMAVNGNVDSTLFTHLADAHETGLYAAANRLGLIVLFGVSVVFSSVLPMLGRVEREAPGEFDAIFSGLVRLICAAGLPLTVAFSLVAPELARLIFGSEFAASWRTLTVYGPYTLAVAFNLLAASNLGIRGRGRTFALAVGCSMALNIILAASGIAIAQAAFGEGAVGAGRLVSGTLSDFCGAALFLRLAAGQVPGRKLLGTVLLAILPGAVVAALQLAGILSSWPARGAVLVVIPLYMLAVGLVRRGDAAALSGLVRDVFKKRAATPVPVVVRS